MALVDSVTSGLPSFPGDVVARRVSLVPSAGRRDQRDPTPDEHAHFWWTATGPFLHTLLRSLQYSDEQERSALDFAKNVIAPSLGRRPDAAGRPARWKSFMTDDFTPIEFSWTWSDDDRSADRRVRLSIEPIGPDAGSAADPWNLAATTSLLSTLAAGLQTLDVRWYNELAALFLPSDILTHPPARDAALSSPSSVFLAFELGEVEPMVKAYLMPSAQASVTGRDEAQIIYDALACFATQHAWQDLHNLLGVLRRDSQTLRFEPIFIAVDCVTLAHARVKVYLRSSQTSFAAVENMMTMFSAAESQRRGLQELRQLYAQLFGLPEDFDPAAQLPSTAHQTGGMLYYVEIRPASTKRTVKVYLPVKHYAKNDLQAATGLTTYLRRHQPGKGQLCDNFMQALDGACSYRALDSARGLQTYVSCAIRNGTLDVTSYLTPEIYRTGRFA